MKPWRVGALFAGLGGCSRGFEDAGFELAFALDWDKDACTDHGIICKTPAHQADLATMSPQELHALSPVRPDVLISSPPCVAFSGCLSEARSLTPEYQAISDLAFRGIWLALEAWTDQPPPLFIIENVPRIASRGRAWLDELAKLFSHYGYAWRESSHDCGELGHLAQHRRRFLGVARHRQQVPEFLYEPPKRRVRGVGEVLTCLPTPLPGSAAGGPMHALPRQSRLNWLRLAAIEAGKDWSALPAQIQLGCKPRSGVFGVQQWDKPSACVVGEARPDNGSWAIADPRSICARRAGALGHAPWNKPVHAIIGAASIQNTGLQVADPRILTEPGELPHQHLACATHQLITGPDGPCLLGEQTPRLDDKRPIHMLIMAPDGAWHRPLTTLELAALQGFEILDDEGAFLCLTGGSHAAWRKRIGNAVPPPTAAAIADSCRRTLDACNAGGLLLSGEPIWVQPSRHDIPPLLLSTSAS